MREQHVLLADGLFGYRIHLTHKLLENALVKDPLVLATVVVFLFDTVSTRNQT